MSGANTNGLCSSGITTGTAETAGFLGGVGTASILAISANAEA